MAVFDGLLNKLNYTAEAVTAIGTAVNEKGAGIELEFDPLGEWADKIRAGIQTGGQASGAVRSFKSVTVMPMVSLAGNHLSRDKIDIVVLKEE